MNRASIDRAEREVRGERNVDLTPGRCSLPFCLEGGMKGKSKQWEADISQNHLMLEWVEPSLQSSSE